MPSDNLVLQVRQIAGYPPATYAGPAATLLMQIAGLGSAYQAISPAALVGTALAQGGDMTMTGAFAAGSIGAVNGTFANLKSTVVDAQKVCAALLCATDGTIGGIPIATQADVAASVLAFNGRSGAVTLWLEDVLAAGGAPIFNPRFVGCPRADTPDQCDYSTRLATTEFVQRNTVLYVDQLLANYPIVFTFNGRSGIVTLTEQDILEAGGGAVFDNVALTGIPTAPTAPPGTNTDQIATCAYVEAAIATAVADLSTVYAPLASPQFSGLPTAPTADPGTSTAQIATTAFVQTAIVQSTTGVASFNTRTGAVVLTPADLTASGGALLNSPAFTGNPTAPTAAPGTNNTILATTAFVMAATGAGGVSSFNSRTGAVALTLADVVAADGAPITSPAFTGNPAAPTPPPGDASTLLATTAFVAAAVLQSVSSFNGRTGAVTLTANDISAAGGAPLASPAFYGVPTAPTAAVGTNTTQLATTAFVEAALAGGTGVASFNGRGGAVVLQSTDVSGAGGALLSGPAFTGVPTAPTAAAATSTAQLATTAFVMNALGGTGPFLPLSGGILSGPLTVNGVTTVGPAAAQSTFDARGNLNLGGLGPSPANAAAATLFTGSVCGSGLSFGSNVYFDGANWRYRAAGPGMIVAMPGGGPFQVLDYASGAAGAVTAGGVTALNLTSAGDGTFGGNLGVGAQQAGGVTAAATIGAAGSGASTLAMVGNGYGSMTWSNTAGRFVTESGATSNITNQWWKYFQNASGTRFWQSFSGANLMNLAGQGNLFIAGALSQGSDARGKTRVVEADDGLIEVLKMTPRRFHRVARAAPADHPGWRVPDVEELGFVAQEMQDALPIAVAETVNVDDERSLGIMLTPIVAALVNAVKQLDARLAALEAA